MVVGMHPIKGQQAEGLGRTWALSRAELLTSVVSRAISSPSPALGSRASLPAAGLREDKGAPECTLFPPLFSCPGAGPPHKWLLGTFSRVPFGSNRNTFLVFFFLESRAKSRIRSGGGKGCKSEGWGVSSSEGKLDFRVNFPKPARSWGAGDGRATRAMVAAISPLLGLPSQCSAVERRPLGWMDGSPQRGG